MKNPDNGKIMFKIKIDATKSNIVDLSGNKLKSDYLSQVLEHQDDTIVNLLSFDYTKLNDSDGEIKLVSSSDLIIVDGSNQVSGLKLSYNGVDVVIPKSDFILQDDKITIKATIKPFELFTVTGNSIEFIVTFTPGVDLTTSRNLSLANLATTKTFTHEDANGPTITGMSYDTESELLKIDLSEEIQDLGEVDYGLVSIKQKDGSYVKYGNILPSYSVEKMYVSTDKKSLLIKFSIRIIREIHFENTPLTEIVNFGVKYEPNVNNIKDNRNNLCQTTNEIIGDNYVLKQPKDIFVYGGTRSSLTDPEILEVDLTFDFLTSLPGDTTTVDNQPDKGFYVVNNNKRYPLDNCIVRNDSSQMTIHFKPFVHLHDVMPDEHGEIKFEVGYDPTIGNLISRFGETFDAFETLSGMGFGYNDTIEMLDWRLESLVNIPDPEGKKDHISTDKLTLIFNKNVDKIENSHLIGHDIHLAVKIQDFDMANYHYPITNRLSFGMTLNERIENVEINGNEVSFMFDLAEFGHYTYYMREHGQESATSEKPVELRYFKYIKDKTTIKDSHRNVVGNFETQDLYDTSKFVTVQRPSDGKVNSCIYNQIDDENGEFVIEFNDYITTFRDWYFKLDLNNSGYGNGIEFIDDSFKVDFNSKTQRIPIKTKELFDKNGIDTTDFKEFKICFPINLVEFYHTYRLPSPNTPDRNYYYDMKHDFIESTRPFKLVDFEVKTVDNVPNDKETTLWAEEITLILNKNIGSVENLNKISHNLSMFYSYARTFYNSNNYDQVMSKEFYNEYDNITLYDTVENISYSGNKIMLKIDLARILFEYKKSQRLWDGNIHADTPKSPYGILGLVLEAITGGAIIKDKYGNEIVSNKSDYGFDMFNYPNDVPKYTLGGRTPVNLVSHRYRRVDRRKGELTLVFDVPVDNLNISDIAIINIDKNISYENGLEFGITFIKTGEYEITITERNILSKYGRLAGSEPTSIKSFSISIQPIYFVFNYMSHPPVLSDANNGVYTFEVTHDFRY